MTMEVGPPKYEHLMWRERPMNIEESKFTFYFFLDYAQVSDDSQYAGKGYRGNYVREYIHKWQ